MEPRLKPSKSSNPLFDVTFYHSIVGSLRYLLHTRPDISFAVGMVSRFMEAPTREHMSAEKHRYIAGTLHYDCSYSRKSGDAGLVGYSDADMAGDLDNRKSTSGTLFFFGYWPVPWQCQKQKVISLSSCESEYIAAATAACQGIWLGQLLGDLLGTYPLMASLLMDNKSSTKASTSRCTITSSKAAFEDGKIAVNSSAPTISSRTSSPRHLGVSGSSYFGKRSVSWR